MDSPVTAASTIYFGYGSNLWKEQMKQRCPRSKYIGIARLKDYRWMINQRGYANIVEVVDEEKHSYAHEVWGLVYSLRPTDEDRLDQNEGVPLAYTKEHIACEFWTLDDNEPIDIDVKPETTDMLVYINRDMTDDDKPKKEYVFRMNQGIQDALDAGIPSTYIDTVLRKFIPDECDRSAELFARKQALDFQEER